MIGQLIGCCSLIGQVTGCCSLIGHLLRVPGDVGGPGQLLDRLHQPGVEGEVLAELVVLHKPRAKHDDFT